MNIKKLNELIYYSLLASIFLSISAVEATEYSANFKGTDIVEFINTISRNLGKTIITEPSIHGKINVRSSNMMQEKQYYQFFLNVLQVYGLATVQMPGGVIKVVSAQNAKKAGSTPLVDQTYPGPGDEIVTRVISVHNVSVKELAPVLRQLNNSSGGGNVINHVPSNMLMITGRAAVVRRLEEIIHKVDRAGYQQVDILRLKYASASEMVRVINSVLSKNVPHNQRQLMLSSVVADDRSNSILISGDSQARRRIAHLINQLDSELRSHGNTWVFYLKYAHATDLVKVLKGVSRTLGQQKKAEFKNTKEITTLTRSDVSIEAFNDNNSLVITAQPETIRTLAKVIRQLDVRRAQVYVKAIIVEVSEDNNANLGLQWLTPDGGTQFGNGRVVPISSIAEGIYNTKSTTTTTYTSGGNSTTTTSKGSANDLAGTLSGISGALMGFYNGSWGALLQASRDNSKANVLATPSITTLDNQQASFMVGEEVPVKTGSTASSTKNNPFTTVKRKEVGIKLVVTPQINKGNTVKLKIRQEVSKVQGQTSVDVIFSKRKLSTTVLVNSGQTIVLGGLIDDDVDQTISKIPILGDLPFIGTFFRSISTSKIKRNLMIFIKPAIVRDSALIRQLSARKYTEIRAMELYRKSQGIDLMPDQSMPVLPILNKNHDEKKSSKSVQ